MRSAPPGASWLPAGGRPRHRRAAGLLKAGAPRNKRRARSASAPGLLGGGADGRRTCSSGAKQVPIGVCSVVCICQWVGVVQAGAGLVALRRAGRHGPLLLLLVPPPPPQQNHQQRGRHARQQRAHHSARCDERQPVGGRHAGGGAGRGGRGRARQPLRRAAGASVPRQRAQIASLPPLGTRAGCMLAGCQRPLAAGPLTCAAPRALHVAARSAQRRGGLRVCLAAHRPQAAGAHHLVQRDLRREPHTRDSCSHAHVRRDKSATVRACVCCGLGPWPVSGGP
jgi:hypothetical protein